jgi:ribosome maturation factor RimP
LHELEEDLLEGTRPGVEGAGVTLLDVEAHPGRGLLVRFIIDAEGGITVEDCVRVDRIVSGLLEESGKMPDRYTVEVTSPGLDRRLRRREEYDHFRGRLIRIHADGGGETDREYRGILEGTDGREVLLRVEKDTIRIALEDVTKARLLFEE